MFAVGDKVTIRGSDSEISPITNIRGYAKELRGRVGLVYRCGDLSHRYLYVFFPELPGSGFSEGHSDPMIGMCYGLYEVDLEPSP